MFPLRATDSEQVANVVRYVLWGVTPPGSYAPSAGYKCLDRHEWKNRKCLGSVPARQEKTFFFIQGTSVIFFILHSASQYFKEAWREGSLKKHVKTSAHAAVTIRMPGLRVCIRNETDLPAISLLELLQHGAVYH